MNTNEETVEVDDFLQRLNEFQENREMEALEAVKLARIFLRARKFDTNRAFSLYRAYRRMRYTQKLDDIDPFEHGVRRELLSEKFTVLPHSSASEPTVLLFSVRRHWPPDCTDRDALKGIIYQLDAAILDEQTQTEGVVVIYDMTNAKYSNFDADLTVKLLNLLTGCFPARLRRVLIVAAPLWFRPPYHISRLFVKEKIRERISAVDENELTRFLPFSSIPECLGGSQIHKHTEWLKCCFSRLQKTDRIPDDYFESPVKLDYNLKGNAPHHPRTFHRNSSSHLLQTAYPKSTSWSHSFRENTFFRLASPLLQSSVNSLQRQKSLQPTSRCRSFINNFSIPSSTFVSVTTLSCPPTTNCSNGTAVQSGIVDGNLATNSSSKTRLSVENFLRKFRSSDSKHYEREFSNLFMDAPLCGTIRNFLANPQKNRYVDVPCLDQSAVKLPKNTYIHANYVHGYKQPNAYILTQGPLDRTISDFWQMVWSTKASIIVMLTRTVEDLRTKCSQYWPLGESANAPTSMTFSPFTITNQMESLEANGLYKLTSLLLSKSPKQSQAESPQSNLEVHKTRIVYHFLFLGWPDFDVPFSTDGMLTFLDAVKAKSADASSSDSERMPPIIIHCSAGIGRTGTFAAIDISLQQAASEGFVDVRDVVSRMRCQRAGSVQLAKQYYFIHRAIFSRLAGEA